MARKQRLDLELVARGLAASRQQAQQLIRAGRVRLGDRLLDKPGMEVAPEAELQVQQPPRFVSRGGEKLVRALECFALPVSGRVCLDGGISTGGFSDCLLQHGASRVYGVDVGYGQTAWSLRSDPRVVLRERTNLRHLTPADLYGPGDPWPDLAVADVSFISLALVLPALLGLLHPQASLDLVLLVKPQFEVGKARVGKGGVVRDPAAHEDAISGVIAAAAGLGLAACALVASPITGPAGNHEYLLWLRRPAAVVENDGFRNGALESDRLRIERGGGEASAGGFQVVEQDVQQRQNLLAGEALPSASSQAGPASGSSASGSLASASAGSEPSTAREARVAPRGGGMPVAFASAGGSISAAQIKALVASTLTARAPGDG